MCALTAAISCHGRSRRGSRIDDTTLELTLRDGMTFHDGKPVTAEDAVFSLNLMVEQQPPVLADLSRRHRERRGGRRSDLPAEACRTESGHLRQGLTDLVILPKHIGKMSRIR